MTALVKNNFVSEYKQRTAKSRDFFLEAQEIMPGGLTANIKNFEPYPIIMDKAKGAYIYDRDGNEYIDYLMSYGALMLGHGHSKILQAVQQQLETDGTMLFGTPHQLEIDMGKKIKEIYPSMERVRYTNSGTEATLFTVRLAHAYTGKKKIAKFEGHYHGGYDQVLISVNPSLKDAGSAQAPKSVSESKGIDPYYEEHTISLPFNDLEHTSEILTENKDDIAAVILEPVQGGFIPAEPSFIEGLREITESLGILLIFDEVKTGFRIGLGGFQEQCNVKPDLTALGKVIGGGFPIGIVGGKKEIMMKSAPTASSDVFDTSQSEGSSARDVLFHSGTYNGHPMILAAGLATIEVLETEMESILNRTCALKNGIESIFEKHDIRAQAIGMGSIFNVVITEKEHTKNYRDLQQANFSMRKKLDFGLLSKGIYTKPLNRYSISTEHGEKEINHTLEAYDAVLTQMN